MQLQIFSTHRERAATLGDVNTSSPVVRRRRLGLELRAIRETNTRLNGDDAARALGWSNSKLSRIETGRTAPTAADVTKLLDLYKVEDAERRDELAVLTREARKKGWWQLYSEVPYSTYIGLEAEASQMLTYQHVVPGLFQTEHYAEAINRATTIGLNEDALEQRLEVRMTRQRILTRSAPLEVRALLDEAAIRRVVGGPQVMREQLERLLEMAELPNVIAQVIPFSAGGHFGTLVGPFVILNYAHPADPDIVYVEGSTDPYPDRDGEIEQYGVMFDHMRAAALSVAATQTLIRNQVKDL
ncbi:helix-turn-helix transcriptional regulator [Streptomyces sp. SID3343]|uniref:helix-turn-helix domain-containing protein n=1 Tax=Streptomyces sp. SID3343 TaxID=2690260 RepID=UPI00136DD3D1|nr:helix-turn-helix transcriptional regulator [Streptomyces sp. SID3343]MYV99063.1 helix-turn-helix domain-containing protein [Streptomyces sp. SID3343]